MACMTWRKKSERKIMWNGKDFFPTVFYILHAYEKWCSESSSHPDCSALLLITKDIAIARGTSRSVNRIFVQEDWGVVVETVGIKKGCHHLNIKCVSLFESADNREDGQFYTRRSRHSYNSAKASRRKWVYIHISTFKMMTLYENFICFPIPVCDILYRNSSSVYSDLIDK